jgi:hypothetical protein
LEGTTRQEYLKKIAINPKFYEGKAIVNPVIGPM